jgi:hypothetical protein
LTEIVIQRRFNGPPDSGHGGYSCGSLAVLVDAPAAEVTLRAPPPLERGLRVEEREGAMVALDGDTVVAEARPVELELEPPEPVSVAEAVAADARSLYRRADLHAFPTCFGCGPERAEGDGLREFPGPVGDGVRHATVFRPERSLADAAGNVRPEVVWAALDCPSSAPVADWKGERRPSVLARLAARIEKPLSAAERYVSVAWPLDEEGRKRSAGSALFTADGELAAIARALWIELRAHPR